MVWTASAHSVDEDRQPVSVVRVDEGEEQHKVENEMHRDNEAQRFGEGERVALQKRKREGEQGAPGLVADLPQKRGEDHGLQQIRLPAGKVTPMSKKKAG